MDFLTVNLGDREIGKLTLLTGDRTFFTFEESYLEDAARPVLSQSFFTRTGGITPETKTTRTRLPPFFSNLLPEGHLRTYLAARGGIKPSREFPLLALLGEDLPGAVTVNPLEERDVTKEQAEEGSLSLKEAPYRFSLAGVQLKFSALAESTGGLTIPASGAGGNWIVKLPALNFPHVPENEWSMLYLAGEMGIPLPETRLIDLNKISGLPDLGVFSGKKALAVKRFDRGEKGKRIHMEDFAQVYNLFPDEKYSGVSYANVANMVWTLTGEKGLTDFIQRLVFTIIIGNGDMHLKNWSFLCPNGKTPQLAPAYDFASTIPYIPKDKLALNLSGTKEMQEISLEHFKKLAQKAQVPEFLLLNKVKETIEAAQGLFKKHKAELPLSKDILKRIDGHMENLKLK